MTCRRQALAPLVEGVLLLDRALYVAQACPEAQVLLLGRGAACLARRISEGQQTAVGATGAIGAMSAMGAI